jgi:GntR family transcriptional regulator
MMIDAGNSIPLYAQVEQHIAADIADGRLPPHSQLPTEDQLIAQFGVSRITIRRAIQNLTARGLVEIRRGKGTFVARPRITQELTELSGFVEDMLALGRHPTARVLDKRVIAAGADVARHLALTPDSRVVRILRVRLADGVPMSLDETYLPESIGLQIMSHDLEVEPIFALLEQRYDIPLLEADYQLEATVAAPEVAAALEIDPGSPIFLIERTSYGVARMPLDYEKLFYRGDAIHFVTRLQRRPAVGPRGETP